MLPPLQDNIASTTLGRVFALDAATAKHKHHKHHEHHKYHGAAPPQYPRHYLEIPVRA